MLGSELKIMAESAGFDVTAYDLPEFDITRRNDIDRIVEESDIIVNCAAYTAVDAAESDPDAAEAVNATAVGALAESAESADRYVIHISTDFVLGDNGTEPLTEESPTNPLSVYGATKLKGEHLLRDSGCRHAVIRVEWSYGEHGTSNFITKIAKAAHEREHLNVVDDQVGAPTATVDIARAILCFMEKEIEGLFHFAADGYASRFETAEFILHELGIDTPVYPCSSEEFPTPAQRPLNSRFNCSKIDSVIDFVRPDWKSSLMEYLQVLRR